MKRLIIWNATIVLMLGLGMFSFSAAISQELFPEQPGRDKLLLVCVQCHTPVRISDAELTADDWEFMLYDMISRGAPVYQEDIEDLKKYLIDNFAIDKK